MAEQSSLQRLLYAFNRYAMLQIFQAIDAAGKAGAIRHVMSGVNPQGCQVFSFPSATELDHDFLCRTTRSLPERCRIGIFNRDDRPQTFLPLEAVQSSGRIASMRKTTGLPPR